jgi:hypothetical protein
MTYKIDLYRNALTIIENIYKESMHNSDVDLYRSFDILQSISENQIRNKEWCAKVIEPYLARFQRKKSKTHVLIMGSWYGLLSQILIEQVNDTVFFDNCDIDPEASNIGEQLKWITLPHLAHKNKQIRFRGAEAFEYFVEDPSKYHMIINTSCEHMDADDLRMIPYMKDAGTVMCMQGNNYHSVSSHINTHNSLDEFTESLGLRKVMWSGKLEQEQYDRYMVIGL